MWKVFSVAYANVSKYEFIMANVMFNDSGTVDKDKRRNSVG